jgi:heme O synthase-like polyprenyltransferase
MLAGTLLVASGAATLKQWMERVWDSQMRRTASRHQITSVWPTNCTES